MRVPCAQWKERKEHPQGSYPHHCTEDPPRLGCGCALSEEYMETEEGGFLSDHPHSELHCIAVSASHNPHHRVPAVLAVLGAGAKNPFGAPGVMVISCIAFHLLQVAIDSALVSFWKATDGQ